MPHLTLQLGAAIVVPFAPPRRMLRYRAIEEVNARTPNRREFMDQARAASFRLSALREASAAAPDLAPEAPVGATRCLAPPIPAAFCPPLKDGPRTAGDWPWAPPWAPPWARP